jgi:hypothetical protein
MQADSAKTLADRFPFSTAPHIFGLERSQLLLLPEAMNDYVGADNPARFVDAFVAGSTFRLRVSCALRQRPRVVLPMPRPLSIDARIA